MRPFSHDWYSMSIGVIHFFVDQRSQSKKYNNRFRFCTFTYIPENFIEKFGLGQKI